MTWDREKLCHAFSKDITAEIVRVPLSPRRPPDKWQWNNTHHGRFSVRSAYSLAVAHFSKCGFDLPSSSRPNPMWNLLWKCKLPPKISHFLWRACHEALLCRSALARRGIALDTICPSCGLASETISHVFFKCPVVVHSWGRSPLKLAHET
ncbi:hypothetical protein ACS0TY_010967 [Phlomoides rotata]